MGLIIDINASNELFCKLEEYGVSYCKSVDLPHIYSPLNTHPDIQIHIFDSRIAIAAPSVFDYYRKHLPKHIKVLCGETDPGGKYPQDCAYNVAAIGKRVFGNFTYVDSVIKNLYIEQGFELVNTKQGYTKCNLCIVDENSVITEDNGLCKCLRSCGIEVLKIPQGGVSMQNFDYGFIGGASGKISYNKLVFSGEISKHYSFDEISQFLRNKDIEYCCLTQNKLTDIGSMLYYKD